MDESRFRRHIEGLIMNGLPSRMIADAEAHGQTLTRADLEAVIAELEKFRRGEDRLGWDRRSDAELEKELRLAQDALATMVPEPVLLARPEPRP